MKVVLDENIPQPLRQFFSQDEVFTVQYLGLAGYKNGELLSILDKEYDVFIIADKNLRYQQDLSSRRIALIELPTNRWPVLKLMAPRIIAAVSASRAGSYTILDL